MAHDKSESILHLALCDAYKYQRIKTGVVHQAHQSKKIKLKHDATRDTEIKIKKNFDWLE